MAEVGGIQVLPVGGRFHAAEVLRAALDALPSSVLLLDDGRGLVHANRAASGMLAARSLFAVEGGKVVATGANRRRFAEAWCKLVEASATSTLQVPLVDASTGNLRADVNRILPSLWMLRLNDEALDADRLAAEWRVQFGLTAAEARVALALLHGGAIEASRSLGLSGNTVRAHLKHMFAKTGCRSQSALLLRLASPVQLQAIA